MGLRDEDYYKNIADRLFCGDNARYGPFIRTGDPEIVVPELIVRIPVRLQDEYESYELSIFDRVEGLAGELWEYEARSLLRLEALDHPALPKIVSGGYDEEEKIAFSITDNGGEPVIADNAIAWAGENRITAFEQFSMLLDALSELHEAHVVHRNLTIGALRARMEEGKPSIRLARFELSSLVGNVLRQVTRQRDEAATALLRQLYLAPQGGLDQARHLAYLAPEMHAFLFGTVGGSRGSWETTDVFGLGVLGWEWFCGRMPDVLPAEYKAVRAAVAAGDWPSVPAALGALHDAMRAHLTAQLDLPRPLVDVLRGMLDKLPSGRDTSFELCRRIEGNWEGIRGVWETERIGAHYLLTYFPDEMVNTVYEARHWISRSPADPAGRAELNVVLERELARAEIVRSPTGAVGYASGPDEDLRAAEWVLIGERALWFCAPYYRKDPFGNRSGKEFVDEIMIIKYVKDKDRASELATARPRRVVGRIDLVPFRMGRDLSPLRSGRPSWRPLTELITRSRRSDSKNLEFLQSIDFLLDYQQTELEARVYPYRVVGPEESGTVTITVDEQRDDEWVHHSPMLTAYAAAARLRPPFGDFFGYSEGDEDVIELEFQEGRRRAPFFGSGRVRATTVERRDQDTITVRMRRGAKLPAEGWVRRENDGGSRVQLDRQHRGRGALDREHGLIRNLRDPLSIDLGRGRWKRLVDAEPLAGDAPQRINDMLSYHPFYALQGPPGSGKTTVAARALRKYLELEAGSRVLVSAQSNFALDNLAARLIEELPEDTLTLRVTAANSDRPPRPPLDKHTLEELTTRVADAARARVRRLLRESVLTPKERALAEEWLSAVQSDKVELGDRIRAGASVVFATCSMAATLYDDATETNRSFDWVIVEEAAKAWPTEIVVPLVLGTRWTLIGDHRQLGAFRSDQVSRFLSSLGAMHDEDMKRHYEAREDRLKVLAMFRELFADHGPASRAPGHVHAVDRLNLQFRMHRDIAAPVGRTFYPARPARMGEDQLPVSFLDTFHTANKPHGVVHPGFLKNRPLVWIDTAGHAGFEDSPYWSNEGEAELIADLVQRMDPPPAPPDADDKADGSLIVLTPYRAQVARLNLKGELRGRVYTVHSYQGREADRVIVSLVRTEQRGTTPMANVGHVGADEVANVLLSRARRLCVLVGSWGHFAVNGGPSWDIITKAVAQYGTIVPSKEVGFP